MIYIFTNFVCKNFWHSQWDLSTSHLFLHPRNLKVSNLPRSMVSKKSQMSKNATNSPIALEGQQAVILPRVPYKGVNFIPETVPVWLVERIISILISTDVSFRDYCYFTNMSVKIMLVKVKI